MTRGRFYVWSPDAYIWTRDRNYLVLATTVTLGSILYRLHLHCRKYNRTVGISSKMRSDTTFWSQHDNVFIDVAFCFFSFHHLDSTEISCGFTHCILLHSFFFVSRQYISSASIQISVNLILRTEDVIAGRDVTAWPCYRCYSFVVTTSITVDTTGPPPPTTHD